MKLLPSIHTATLGKGPQTLFAGNSLFALTPKVYPRCVGSFGALKRVTVFVCVCAQTGYNEMDAVEVCNNNNNTNDSEHLHRKSPFSTFSSNCLRCMLGLVEVTSQSNYTVVGGCWCGWQQQVKLLADHQHHHARKRTNNIVRYYCSAKKK